MPSTPFYAIAHPDGEYPTLDNAEIVQVTNVSTDTLTIDRAELGTSAKSIAVTWRISNPFLKEDYDDRQPLDADLTTIAGLSPSNDDFLVRSGGAWANRTPTQSRTHLGLGALATLSAVTESEITLADNTTNNSSTTKHGFLKKLDNTATNFMDGTGNWDSVKDSDLSTSDITDNNATTSKHGFLKKLSNTASEFINGAGNWVNPVTVLSNPYKFYAYRNAAHNSSNSLAKISFDTEVFDTNSNFASGTYTAPVAGFYEFHATAGNTLATSTPMQIALFKNGSVALYGTIINPPNAGTLIRVDGILQLAASDTVDVYFVGGNGSVMYTGIATCYFQGHLISIT